MSSADFEIRDLVVAFERLPLEQREAAVTALQRIAKGGDDRADKELLATVVATAPVVDDGPTPAAVERPFWELISTFAGGAIDAVTDFAKRISVVCRLSNQGIEVQVIDKSGRFKADPVLITWEQIAVVVRMVVTRRR